MLVLRGLIGGLVQMALFGALLLIPAGTWHWPRATQFLMVYGFVLLVSIVTLARLAPESLEARLSAPVAKSQPVADRFITLLFAVSFLAWLVFISTDVFQLRLLPPPPVEAAVLGALISFCGYGVIWTSLLQNAFAAPIVKDQSERGQVLIDSGLYARVRHPFYLGLLLFLFGLALWLGSYAGSIAVLLFLVLMVARIKIEERTLVENLPGYAEYTRRVRYRLVPFLW
ncbi:MAG: isoprenylcysteine carboxylmethyltransferase family protein [Deltaproteobacteria bacterium]|nr:isoprenylcysteine carboxylmethyltransferase family protein [Deltaproteobacteria bacterium]